MFPCFQRAALDSSVISYDISVAPEVCATLESNCRQQITLFVRISKWPQCGGVGVNRKTQWEERERGRVWQETMEREREREIRELLCEFAVKGVVFLRHQNCQGRYQESNRAHDKTLTSQ